MIVKNIPRKKIGRPAKYEFEKLNKGDSLVIGIFSRQLQRSVINSAKSWAANNRKTAKFETQQMNGTLIIQRIA